VGWRGSSASKSTERGHLMCDRCCWQKAISPALAAELIAFCQQHLSHIKCPRSVDFEAELPRHPTGKLYKRLLRDRYWAGHANRLV